MTIDDPDMWARKNFEIIPGSGTRDPYHSSKAIPRPADKCLQCRQISAAAPNRHMAAACHAAFLPTAMHTLWLDAVRLKVKHLVDVCP